MAQALNPRFGACASLLRQREVRLPVVRQPVVRQLVVRLPVVSLVNLIRCPTWDTPLMAP